MAGVTESEGTSWASGGSFGKNKMSNTSVHITKAELKTQIKSQFHLIINDSYIDEIYNYYISHIDESNQTLLRKSYIAILSDTIITCPTYLFAENMAQFSAKNKVYFYELTYNNEHSSCHNQEWKGVCHGDDLAFIFSNALSDKSTSSQTDYKFTVMVNQLWTNFAKNGYNSLLIIITKKSHNFILKSILIFFI